MMKNFNYDDQEGWELFLHDAIPDYKSKYKSSRGDTLVVEFLSLLDMLKITKHDNSIY